MIFTDECFRWTYGKVSYENERSLKIESDKVNLNCLYILNNFKSYKIDGNLKNVLLASVIDSPGYLDKY